MTTNVCISGGAEGADLMWKQVAKNYEHNTIDYIFKGKVPKNAIVADKNIELSSKVLLKADPMLKLANRYLSRKYPTRSLFVNNLLRKTYYVVNDVEKVYAVGWINSEASEITNIKEATKSIDGGTAWACQLYIMTRLRDRKYVELYFFDQNTNSWYQYNIRNVWDKLEELPPKPSGIYAGIGSRNIIDDGKQAIENLYVN